MWCIYTCVPIKWCQNLNPFKYNTTQQKTYYFTRTKCYVLWPPCVADADILFCHCDYCLSSFFFLFSCLFSAVADWMSTYFHTWCGLSTNLECRSEMMQKLCKESPSQSICSQLKHVSTIKKNLLNSNISPTCPYNMANFGLLAVESCWRVWAPLQISAGFASWQCYCTAV